MELWDLYNDKREPLKETIVRGENMKAGYFHIVVSIWTVNSKREILVTLRDPNKDKYPDLWENTAGSVIAGETSIEAAIRELREETGIAAGEEELTLIDTIKEESAFVDMYMIKKDIPLNDLTLQEGETVDAKWITLEELDNIINEGIVAAPVARRLNIIRENFLEYLNR